MADYQHICGVYYIIPGRWGRQYLPQIALSVNAQIIASTSRTTLTQTFVSKRPEAIPELRYTFPLYDGVSVVGFTCTINNDRVIRGVVKERVEARKTFQAAVSRGETAGLLEQLPNASDVFTTTVGNVPAGATIKVEITYLGELKHDAEVDGIRFTIPTSIAPRYGSYPGQLDFNNAAEVKGGISIVIDAEMPNGSNIKSVQSPSHPIAVTVGNTSTGAAQGAEMSLQKASATLSLGSAELDKDFVLQVVTTNTSNPIAVLETHPTIPNHRALMATLVPKFNLPSSRPEIVFICDRSGSMWSGKRIPNLKTALKLFLKSLPLGVKFNICSFGSRHEFLFPGGSRSYDASSLEEATRYVDRFDANFGGTEMHQPMLETFTRRFKDMQLEVFLLTDGEIWDQDQLFKLINDHVDESKGDIRVFSLGIGNDVSHALIEGVARAGNGFAQTVGDDENMNSKVVRMLKASLTPHIKDYTLEVKYEKGASDRTLPTEDEDDFEIVEKVMDGLALGVEPEEKGAKPPKTISLFDESADPDTEMMDADLDTSADGKYSHVPAVSEPKILQAPFVIPPLYPFSRTSVYLLLSPEASQKQPKSVVLRGTSAHGPLELEIPITILKEKGETIHQLAARKSVKELEEGRGWIHHAKDAKDDKLLKDKYEGRFSDMVEREAVRLGVTYQVGGKWCSFVAVEGNQDFSKETVASTPALQSENPVHSYSLASKTVQSNFLGSPANPSVSQPRKRFAAAGPAPASFGATQAFGTNSATGGLFGSARSPNLASTPVRAPPRSRALFFDAAAPPPPPPPSVCPAPTSFGAAPSGLFRAASAKGGGPIGSACPAPPPGSAYSSREAAVIRRHSSSSEEDCGYGLTGDGPGYLRKSAPTDEVATAALAPASVTVDDVLLAQYESEMSCAASAPLPNERTEVFDDLVALQAFEGQWKWTDQLLRLLFWHKKDGVTSKAAAAGLGSGSDELATALVLLFLEVVCTGEKDEWEMLVEKAKDWLQGQIAGKVSFDDYMLKVRKVFGPEFGGSRDDDL